MKSHKLSVVLRVALVIALGAAGLVVGNEIADRRSSNDAASPTELALAALTTPPTDVKDVFVVAPIASGDTPVVLEDELRDDDLQIGTVTGVESVPVVTDRDFDAEFVVPPASIMATPTDDPRTAPADLATPRYTESDTSVGGTYTLADAFGLAGITAEPGREVESTDMPEVPSGDDLGVRILDECAPADGETPEACPDGSGSTVLALIAPPSLLLSRVVTTLLVKVLPVTVRVPPTSL